MRRVPLFFLVAVLVYLGLRGYILHTDFDRVCVTQYELHPMGNMAKNLKEGEGFPLIGFCDTHSGGELVTGLLAYPLYVFLGDSYLSLKLVPLLLGLGILVLIHGFLNAHFGRSSAAIGAVLFALAPTLLVSHSVTAMGNHFEILLFLMMVLAVFYRFHWGEGGQKTLVLLGLFSGLAVFHNFSSLLTLGILGFIHLVLRGWRNSIRDLAFLLPGFAVALVPLLLINLGTEGGGLTFLGTKFTGEGAFSPSEGLSRLANFFLYHLADSSCYPDLDAVGSQWPRYLYLACFSGAFLYSAIRIFNDPARFRDKAAVLPFLLYLPVFALAYVLGDFRLGDYKSGYEIGANRYFLTHHLFAVILIAVAAPRLWSRGRPLAVRAGGVLLAAVPVLLGLTNFSLGDFSFQKAGLGLQYEGFYYPKFSRGLLGSGLNAGPEKIESHLAGFQPLHRHRVYAGIGYLRCMTALRPSKENREEYRRAYGKPPPEKVIIQNLNLPELISLVPKEYRIDAARGMGARVRDYLMDEKLLDQGLKRKVVEQLEIHPHPASAYLLEGLCLNQEFVLERESKGFMAVNLMLLRREPAEKSAPPLRRGEGIFCGRLLCRGLETEKEAVNTLLSYPVGATKDFLFGLGWGLADGGEEPALERLPADSISGKKRGWVLLGFGACLRHLYGIREGKARVDEISERLAENDRRKIREGVSWPDYPDWFDL